MNEVLTSEVGVYVMSILVGVGIGLVSDAWSGRVWVGSMLVVAAFVIQISTYRPSAIWAAPLLVLALGVTALVVVTHRYSHSALLAGEPLWRKVLLVFAHGRKVREAASRECAEDLRDA
jgi:hypothetical protein